MVSLSSNDICRSKTIDQHLHGVTKQFKKYLQNSSWLRRNQAKVEKYVVDSNYK